LQTSDEKRMEEAKEVNAVAQLPAKRIYVYSILVVAGQVKQLVRQP
jgi:hypothetical protein